MNLLNKLTIKNLKLNKKRTIVTIIGIILSVALLTAVSTMYFSFYESIINFEKYEKGDFHVMYQDVNKDDFSLIKNNRKVDDIFLTSDIGYAKIDSKNEYKPYAFIKGFTNDSIKHLSIKLVDGRMPENDREILIPTHLKTNGKLEYKIGDEITLEVGKRIRGEQELNQYFAYATENDIDYYDEFNNPVYAEKEEIIDTKTITYKVVGIMERPASNIENYDAPGYTFATLINENNIDKANVYVKYNKEGMKDYLETTATILGVDPELFKKLQNGAFDTFEEYESIANEISDKIKYDIVVNDYLIILESDPLGDGTMQGLGTAVLIVSLIIIVSSIYCIKNSFDISIVEKTKQYGMLRSIGATKKQIRHNVLYEAFALGVVAIPLGLILGLLASFILCLVCNYLLLDLIEDGFKIAFVINYLAVLFAIILGIVTIFLSAIKSAWKASHISPIDSIRNSGEIKIKKQYNSKIINKLFGIGGVISYKNIKRNKKKYRTTIISIIVSVTVFITLSYFVSLFYLTVKKDVDRVDYNISYSINVTNEETKKKVNDSVHLEYVEDYSIQRREYSELINPKITKNDEYQIDINNYAYAISIISIGDYQYNKYLKELGLSNMDNKAIIFDYFIINKDKKRETFHVLDYKVGDKITINCIDINKDIEIGAIVEKVPYGVNTKYLDSSLMIISDSMYDTLYKDETYYNVMISASDPDKVQDIIEKEIYSNDEYMSVENSKEQEQMIRNLLLLICIFLYGFIIVVSLIGVTNIFNTITTSMELRKPEFAMLKSIGMTSNEFNKMIRLESIFICTKALIISIILGSGLSYLIYLKLMEGSGISFVLPIKAIIGSIVGVLLLIYILMKFSINKINKQNTIETIRNENI